jgi:uncharacterized protein YciI
VTSGVGSALLSVAMAKRYRSRMTAEGADDPIAARVAENRWHWLMFLMAGPRRDQDEATAERIQREHLAHMFELETSGQLTLFGPVMDAGDLRGIGVLTVATREEAEALMSGDPAVVAGRLRLEIHEWFAHPGDRLPE